MTYITEFDRALDRRKRKELKKSYSDHRRSGAREYRREMKKVEREVSRAKLSGESRRTE